MQFTSSRQRKAAFGNMGRGLRNKAKTRGLRQPKYPKVKAVQSTKSSTTALWERKKREWDLFSEQTLKELKDRTY